MVSIIIFNMASIFTFNNMASIFIFINMVNIFIFIINMVSILMFKYMASIFIFKNIIILQDSKAMLIMCPVSTFYYCTLNQQLYSTMKFKHNKNNWLYILCI